MSYRINFITLASLRCCMLDKSRTPKGNKTTPVNGEVDEKGADYTYHVYMHQLQHNASWYVYIVI